MLELLDSPSIAMSESVGPARKGGHLKGRVLVTGGNGFIGQHLVAALAARVEAVRVLDPSIPAHVLPGIEHVQGSVLDHATVLRALDGVTCVYHLAALANLWTADRADFDRVNHGGTEIMLAAAREKEVARFVHCSTEAVLMPLHRRDGACDEASVLTLDDMAGPYSCSKYRAEQAALAAAAGGQQVVIVNPTLPIGAGDYNFTPPTAMLAHYLSGSRVYLDCMLNLVDARDLAQGMMLAADRGRSGERYLLGGENVSLRDLLTMLDGLAQRKLMRVRVPRWLALTTGHVCEWLADAITRRAPIATAEGVHLALRSAPLDCGKAMRELGYRPRPIADALSATVRWIMSDPQHRAAARLTAAPVGP
jgi:dihydroflavonol-4-reductase